MKCDIEIMRLHRIKKYTLQNFWRYNKVNLGELVPLEILGDR